MDTINEIIASESFRKMISITDHVNPAREEIWKMYRVKPVPDKLKLSDHDTGASVILKFKSIVESDYFKELPWACMITWGLNEHFMWRKKDALSEYQRIIEYCLPFLGVPMPTMKTDFTDLSKLHKEDSELGQKIMALKKSYESLGFKDKVGEYQYNLLAVQYTAMLAYRQVLSMRIDDLEKR